MAKKHSDCSCPSDGSYFCVRCLQLAARAGLTLLPLTPSPLRPDVAEEPEGAFMERLRKLAVDDLKLLFYHTYSSKRSTPGWPDTAIIHPEGGVLHLWELKATSGVESPAQKRWRHALERATSVDAGVYWPKDLASIVKSLQEGNKLF